MDNQALIKAIEEADRAFVENKRTDHVYGIRVGSSPIAPWPTEPCNILFLDFDGVLNSELSAIQSGSRYMFFTASVTALNKILKETAALIVISSTWRENWTLKENANFLEKAGVIQGRIVGKTLTSNRERGFEIDSWLRSAPYTVKSFAILDDRDDMKMHRNRLVLVNPQVGLTPQLAEKAIELLSKSLI